MKCIWRSTIRFTLFSWTVPLVARRKKSQFGGRFPHYSFDDYVYIDGICESAYLREPYHPAIIFLRSRVVALATSGVRKWRGTA